MLDNSLLAQVNMESELASHPSDCIPVRIMHGSSAGFMIRVRITRSRPRSSAKCSRFRVPASNRFSGLSLFTGGFYVAASFFTEWD